MANVVVVNALGSAVYLQGAGAGTDLDPHIPQHVVNSITAALPAGTNNIGDADILSLVGDNVDMDSGAGADNHAGVAVLLPGAGGHVVGGVGANPFRVDPVGSTIQPISIASWFPGAGVVASIAGNAAVTASVIGNPAVLASIAGVPSVLASIPNVPKVSIASWFPGAGVVASVVGLPSVVGSVNVGNFPALQPISIASWFAGAQVVASTIGTMFAVVNTGAVGTQNAVVNTQATVNIAAGNVLASIAGNPAVIASIAGLPSVAVASFGHHVRPFTTLSQWQQVARVTASMGVAAAQAAPGANLYNLVTGISVINAAASYGGLVHIADGTGTIFAGYALIGGGFVRTFPAGLKPAANATVFVNVPVYSLDLLVTIDGFVGA